MKRGKRIPRHLALGGLPVCDSANEIRRQDFAGVSGLDGFHLLSLDEFSLLRLIWNLIYLIA